MPKVKHEKKHAKSTEDFKVVRAANLPEHAKSKRQNDFQDYVNKAEKQINVQPWRKATIPSMMSISN